ncbi:hypothetical protein RJ639_046531 [Escallonia herrerae]|uniref:J domain-containing protein n=1 Tax=Escallonia herrerae TaxID=1293975 RepID=A0AA88W5N8_9ASTE|nr:hypothetical protein RJ639_046531 [Escallonia herrerae]
MEGNDTPTTPTTHYKDYYKVLEVDYDATDEKIRLNYRKLALKWHPDKHKGDDAVTAKFQKINEAYTDGVRSKTIVFRIYMAARKQAAMKASASGARVGIMKNHLQLESEYLTRFKGMILTCNGLGIGHTSVW